MMLYLNVDITNFIDWFVNLFVSFFSYFFNLLDTITFHNISLLDYCIAVVIIGIIFPILISLGSNYLNANKREFKKSRSKGSD